MLRRQLDWRLSIYTAIGAALVVVAIALTNWFDFGEIGYFLLVAPIVAIVLLIRALVRDRSTRFAMFASYCLVTALMFKGVDFCRTYGRWLLSGKESRQAVSAQSEPVLGDFRHIVWDGWGFAGSDTDAYLVFDPTDTLARRICSSKAGRMNQYLCGAWRVYRLQANWYSVVFYTNEGWGDCAE